MKIVSKMRIKLYDPKTQENISDRLVEQVTEFNMGPKEKHEGPISIEFNLEDQEACNQAIEYLRKLTGQLPIVAKEKKVKATKKIDDMLNKEEPIKDLLRTTLENAKFQEDIIESLRKYNFKFMASDILEEITKEKPDLFTLREKDAKYQFLIRLVKEAKDPANDKWDYRLAFGIKFMGKRIDSVVVYLWGKYLKTKKIEWKNEKGINFKKVEKVYIFPEYMTYEERRKWRFEHRKLTANPEYKPSKAYERWKPYVKGI